MMSTTVECGVYVLFYVDQCLKNGAVEIGKCFNRYNLKKIILETCEDATNTCVKCSFEVEYGVQCDNCDRWVHLNCTLNGFQVKFFLCYNGTFF
jgi:methionyl-tRNA synthetase